MHELAGTVRITVPHQSKALNSHQQVTELMELSFVKQHYAQYLRGGINMSPCESIEIFAEILMSMASKTESKEF